MSTDLASEGIVGANQRVIINYKSDDRKDGGCE